MKVKKNANAKINIGLEVLNKRGDNFHNINTIFYSLSNLYDEIIFEKNDSDVINITSNVPDLNSSDNLIAKAIKKIERKKNKKFGLNIELKKNIPMGAGLGGGSSDAATTIIAVDQIYELGLSYNEKLILAQAVGSDVPFFLQGGAALGRSRGETLTYFNYDVPFKKVIVFPDIHVSTPNAYKKLNRDFTPRKMVDFVAILEKTKDNPSLFKSMIKNDFEKPIFEDYPEIKEIKLKLYEEGAVFSQMSGSGSSVFAFFENDIDLKSIKNVFSKYQVFEAN